MGTTSASKSVEETYTIEGMHCASCAATIEKGLSSVSGVSDVRVNFAMGSAAVSFQPDIISAEEIPEQVKRLGYGARPRRADDILSYADESRKARRTFIQAAAFVIPLYLIHMLAGAGSLPAQVTLEGLWAVALVTILATLTLIIPGRGVFSDAWKQATNRSANMNSLISLGVGAAFGLSAYNLAALLFGGTPLTNDLYFESAGVIIALTLFGRFLEAHSGGKTKEAIAGLLQLQPAKATAIINGVQVEIDSASARPGMTLLIRPGETIPADGRITTSEPTVDESMLTGESTPAEKSVGDEVIGGSINGSRPFEMEVSAAGEASYLSSIIRLVSEAQNSRAPIQRLADRLSAVFVPVALAIAVLTFLGWWFFGGELAATMLFSAPITVLIIACPCALGLATPTATLAGTGTAARQGILVKGAEIVERLVRIDTVVFDKTGTLTFGQPEVVAMHSLGDSTHDDILSTAASLECESEHPLAEGVMREVSSRNLTYKKAEDIEALSGFGIKGTLSFCPALVGNKAAMEKAEVDVSQLEKFANEEMDKGRTLVYVALDGQPLGALALMDRIRPEASAVISELKESGLQVFMFTGDNRRAARATASLLGIDNLEYEVRPEQKSELIEALTRIGRKVVMIGDGINDAPALAKATVGVAIGSGADIAKSAADVVLMRSDLRYLLATFSSARETFRVIKQNLFWAFAYNIVAIPIAAGVFYPAFGWRLTPELGALAMAFSSVLVVMNSVRLNWSKAAVIVERELEN